MTTVPVKIKTEMVESEGFGIAILYPDTHNCDKESGLGKYNIIGFQGLNIRRYMMDFTHGLKILTRRIDGNEKIKVGDQIISVNGEKITEENICHYYDLLKEAKDWSGFEIEVK